MACMIEAEIASATRAKAATGKKQGADEQGYF
jgi:hypothetical protein